MFDLRLLYENEYCTREFILSLWGVRSHLRFFKRIWISDGWRGDGSNFEEEKTVVKSAKVANAIQTLKRANLKLHRLTNIVFPSITFRFKNSGKFCRSLNWHVCMSRLSISWLRVQKHFPITWEWSSYNILVTAYCYGVMYKVSHVLQPFPDLLCVLISFLIIPESSAKAL
jgi:hypothetical protein